MSVELFRQYKGSVSAKPESLSACWVHALILAALHQQHGDSITALRFTSGTAKSSITDERLRRLGLWVKGTHKGHERDAMRLLVLAERKISERI